MLDLQTAIAEFRRTRRKRNSRTPAQRANSEDQLRAPLEGLFANLAGLCGFKRDWVAAVGESSLSSLKNRPDYAITLRNVLVGYVEVKSAWDGLWQIHKSGVARNIANKSRIR